MYAIPNNISECKLTTFLDKLNQKTNSQFDAITLTYVAIFSLTAMINSS
jgi:hypothetical protein